ncbi:hypothetical protein ACIQI8_20350 [Streptomyces sp. NPDC092369]|uniref:hypothetical protein n=1 Tax=Streptomyces sp. NPDC092369 TaxID=3366015 RepID=UPI0038022A0F
MTVLEECGVGAGLRVPVRDPAGRGGRAVDADVPAASPTRRPSAVPVVAVSAFIMLGDAVRDALDPKLR